MYQEETYTWERGHVSREDEIGYRSLWEAIKAGLRDVRGDNVIVIQAPDGNRIELRATAKVC